LVLPDGCVGVVDVLSRLFLASCLALLNAADFFGLLTFGDDSVRCSATGALPVEPARMRRDSRGDLGGGAVLELVRAGDSWLVNNRGGGTGDTCFRIGCSV
jgi:hypothetical protein